MHASADHSMTSLLSLVAVCVVQYAEAAYTIAKRKWYGKEKVARYVPDYTKCIDHFCLHAGK